MFREERCLKVRSIGDSREPSGSQVLLEIGRDLVGKNYIYSLKIFLKQEMGIIGYILDKKDLEDKDFSIPFEGDSG